MVNGFDRGIVCVFALIATALNGCGDSGGGGVRDAGDGAPSKDSGTDDARSNAPMDASSDASADTSSPAIPDASGLDDAPDGDGPVLDALAPDGSPKPDGAPDATDGEGSVCTPPEGDSCYSCAMRNCCAEFMACPHESTCGDEIVCVTNCTTEVLETFGVVEADDLAQCVTACANGGLSPDGLALVSCFLGSGDTTPGCRSQCFGM